MGKIKKILCMLLVCTMIIAPCSLLGSVFAQTNNSVPLTIEVSTDKSSYNAYGIAEITVNVTNTSAETVNNISAEAIFNDLSPVGKNSETSKEIESLKSGESFNFSYKATVNASKVKLNFFEKIILWFVRLFNGGYTATGNNFDDNREYISKTNVIDFGKVSANNEIKVWYEYNSASIVTRGNWILMLSDIWDWESKTANADFEQVNCFNDISGKECENAVKYASTLGLFDSTTGQFSPDSPATREFVAVTAVRALNFYETESIDCIDKSQILHPKEVYIAVSTGILQIENNYFYPNKTLSVNQITNVLEKISDILDSTIIDENHENKIIYTDKVIELSDDVDYQQNGAEFEFSISAETDKLEVGSIFVLSDYTPYKITSISQENGKYIVKTEEAPIEETLKSINIEGSENISSSSFIPAEGVEIVQPRATRSAISMENINLKVEKEVEQDIFLYAELSIKDPRVEYKIDIDWSKIIPQFNNVYLKFVFDMEVKGGFKSNDSGKNAPSKAGGISLGKYPVMGAFGTGIYIEVALEYSIDGKIELVMTLHGETGFQIYNNQPRGISELSPNFDFPSLEANAKFGPKISGLLCIIRKWDLIDFSLYAGAATKSSLKIRDSGISCLSAHGYVFAELQALKKGIVGKWLNLEYDWKIWDEENSCLKKQWHFENLIYVPECTYGDEVVDFVNVSGTIKDSITNEPIEGATIYCEEMGTSCVTDKNGKFTIAIKSISIGHTFKVTHKDYNWKEITIASNSYSLLEEIKLIQKNSAELEDKNSTISGFVKDETTGNAISGVNVEVVDNLVDGFDPVITTTTDENGLFSVKLPYGIYSLLFSHDNYEHNGTTVNVDTENVVLTEPVLLTPKDSSGDDENIKFSGGDGTEENPYQVSTPEQLDEVRNYLDCHFIQTADIDLAEWADWEPIGKVVTKYSTANGTPLKLEEYYFTGSYNGNGFSINNLNINDSDISPHYDSFGLFAGINNATIININLINANIHINKSTTDYEQIWLDEKRVYSVCVGGIVGICYGDKSLISGCVVSGEINVTDCNNAYVGGITGFGNPLNSKNYADICVLATRYSRNEHEDSKVHCGGITGHSQTVNSKISKCENHGSISATGGIFVYVGGITGIYGQISDCINYGNISGVFVHYGATSTSFENCCVGGINGANTSDYIKNCINYGNISAYDFSDNNEYYSQSGYGVTAGGISGDSTGGNEIISCYNLCNSINANQERSDVGRIAGSSSKITNCYSSKDTLVNDGIIVSSLHTTDSISKNINGGDLSKEEFLKEESYIGFDFKNTWKIDPEIGGAVLQ